MLGVTTLSNEIPSEFRLYPNYPNPFNAATTIRFDVPANFKPRTSNIKLFVFDLLGREAATLVSQDLEPGVYQISFDASALPSGVYFYRLESNDIRMTKSMILIK
jgi:hypothetical protein